MQPEIIELNSRAREEGKSYPKKRFIYAQVKKYLNERLFIAIIGPRGVGKTVILKQLLAETPSSFYVSLDTEKPDEGLFETAKQLSERGIKLLLLDEVHAYPGFEKEIKKIYDFLPLNVVFTSSSALSLEKSIYDLSRRIRIIYAPPFSMREFIFFEKNEELPPLFFRDLLDENSAREYYGKVIHVENLFDDYLKGRNYPFTMGKSDFLPLFRSMVQTIISKDLLMAGRISPEEELQIKKILAFIGTSPVEDINYSSIAKNTGITKYKAEKLVNLLEKAFVLKCVLPIGTNVLKEPKVLLAPPFRLLYRDYNSCIGALREDFFVDAISSLGFTLNYLKTQRGKKTPDYLVNQVVFEIGGVSKGISQFKDFKAKNKIILTHPGKIDADKRPLFFVGFLDPKLYV